MLGKLRKLFRDAWYEDVLVSLFRDVSDEGRLVRMKSTTDISVVLDRSGSMASCSLATINGFNEFVKGQRDGPDDAVLSLYQFDNFFDTVYQGQNIKHAPLLNSTTFVPRGSTALLDAIGRTIEGTGQRLAQLPEKERPSKVIIAIITDGEENSSRSYSRSTIFNMITHQRDKYSWNFVFMGANQDSYAEAGSLGILHGDTRNYAPTPTSSASAFRSMSSGLIGKRMSSTGLESLKCSNFSPEDQLSGDNESKAAGTLSVKDQVKATIDQINRQTMCGVAK